jgi:bacteriocin-type transport-associated protein
MREVLYVLGELSDADVEWMIAHGRRERKAAGTILIQEGGAIGALYILLEGQLAVSVEARPGCELTRMGAGEIVGEVSLVDLRPPSATVRVVEDALLLSIPRDVLSVKLESDPGFAARFYRAVAVFLAYRLRDTMAQLGDDEARASLREEDREEDELDLNVMDKVYLAGQRFERILKRLATEHID